VVVPEPPEGLLCTDLGGKSQMYRVLTKIMVSLALAVGLPFVVAPTTTANAATSPNVCASQRAHVVTSQHRALAAKRNLIKVQRHPHAAHHRAHLRAAKRRVNLTKHNLTVTHQRYSSCQRAHRAGGSNAGVSSASPIQALCDAGVPQGLCDALANIVPGGTTTSLSIGQLCTAAPQAQPLCDALSGGGVPDLGSLQSVLTQVLNALGLGDLLDQLGLGDLTGLLDGLI